MTANKDRDDFRLCRGSFNPPVNVVLDTSAEMRDSPFS